MVSPTLQTKYAALQKAFDATKEGGGAVAAGGAVGKLLTGLKVGVGEWGHREGWNG